MPVAHAGLRPLPCDLFGRVMEYRSLESIPGELVAALWRHKFKAAITAVVILALTAGFLVISERQFTSEAKLFVRIGRESVSLDPTLTETHDDRHMHMQRHPKILK